MGCSQSHSQGDDHHSQDSRIEKEKSQTFFKSAGKTERSRTGVLKIQSGPVTKYLSSKGQNRILSLEIVYPDVNQRMYICISFIVKLSSVFKEIYF